MVVSLFVIPFPLIIPPTCMYSTPVVYTCILHLYSTPVFYTCILHLYNSASVSLLMPSSVVHCPPHPSWEHLMISTDSTQYGTTLNATCEAGTSFGLQSSRNITIISTTCTQSGTWWPAVPQCKGISTSVQCVDSIEV